MSTLAALASPMGMLFLIALVTVGGFILAFSGTFGQKAANSVGNFFSKKGKEDRARHRAEKQAQSIATEAASMVDKLKKAGEELVSTTKARTENWVESQRAKRSNDVNVIDPTTQGA